MLSPFVTKFVTCYNSKENRVTPITLENKGFLLILLHVTEVGGNTNPDFIFSESTKTGKPATNTILLSYNTHLSKYPNTQHKEGAPDSIYR